MQLKHLPAVGVLLSVFTVSAHADLTSTVNGLGVYDSAANITWTSDADLLGTMEANAISQNGSDSSLITAIINANGGVIHDTPNEYYDNGTWTLSGIDFPFSSSASGNTTWWGALAFIGYLNSIDYAGSNQWALPSQPDQSMGFNITNSQFGELFNNEAGSAISANSLFHNLQLAYWTGTEYAADPDYAFYYATYDNPNYQGGYQGISYKIYGPDPWAVSPGNIGAAVPLPGALWLFSGGLIGLLGVKMGVPGISRRINT